MTPTKVLIGQMLVVFGITLAGTWAATQWVAYSLGFQQRLGEPWFLIANLPVYYPWRLFEWWYVYDAYASLPRGYRLRNGRAAHAQGGASLSFYRSFQSTSLVAQPGHARR